MITRYLARNILHYFFLMVFLLLGIQFALSLSYESGFIGQGTFGIIEAVKCTLLSLPHDLYIFSPIISMLAVLWGLNRLNADQELIIIRVNGYSAGRLFKEIGYLFFWVILALVLLGELISPKALRLANRIKTEALTGGNLVINQQGNWLKQDHQVLKFQDLHKGYLGDIYLYEIGNRGEVIKVTRALRGYLKHGQLVLVNPQEISISGDSIKIDDFKEQTTSILINRDLKQKPNKKEANQYSLKEAREIFFEQKRLGIDYLKYEMIYWQRVFIPFSILVMALLGIVPVLKNDREKRFFQLSLGVILGFIYHTLTQIAGYLAIVYNFPVWISTLFPPVCLIFIGALWLY